MSVQPVLLVTNDDGIDAEGLTAVADVLGSAGEVWVVAPETERSAASHALTLRRPIAVEPVGVRRFAVRGTPADAVLLAVKKLIPTRPAIVVSGINHGPNLGDDVNYSGTVAAAMEGTILGIPSLAVSLTDRSATTFDLAAGFTMRLVRRILEAGLPNGCMINVNVPNLPRDQIRGVKVTRLGRRTYEDMIREDGGDGKRKCYWIGDGRPLCEAADDTDSAAIAEGWITATPLGLDMTDHAALDEVRGWALDLPEPDRVL